MNNSPVAPQAYASCIRPLTVFRILAGPPPGVTSVAVVGSEGESFGCPSGALLDKAKSIALPARTARPRFARSAYCCQSPGIPAHDCALYSTKKGLNSTASTPGFRGFSPTVHACQTHGKPQFSGT